MPPPLDVRNLEPYVQSKLESQRLAAILKSGVLDKAAVLAECDPRTLQRLLARLRSRRDNDEAGVKMPGDHHIPEGMVIDRMSKMVENEEGYPTWIKLKADVQYEQEKLQDMRDALLSEITPEPRLPKNKIKPNPNYLNMYLVTDYHLGMKCWHEETRGDNWDTKIAEDLLIRWFQRAIQESPPAKVALFAQLGDFTHWDSLLPITPTSGHMMDADTRFQYMVRVAIRVLRRVIAMLSERHDQVVVLQAEGNHDLASSAWLREAFYALYEGHDNITVIRDPDPYYCYEHDKVSLFFHHGHLRKQPNLDKSFVYKFREVFGRTKVSYGHMGHLHHNKVLETELMEIEQHQTLASADAYASRHGFGSARSAKVITYDGRYGEVWRRTLRPEEV